MAEPTGDNASALTDAVTDTGVFETVLNGYEAVYEALPRSRTFNDIWRSNAYRAEFPEEFAHIGFLTLDEGRRLVELLGLEGDGVLVDVACGAGGPGLWTARETGTRLIGIDPSAAGLAAARARSERTGLAARASFQQGTFERTGLPDGVANAVMTIEAFQYAPDKRAALAEFHRVLTHGGRVGIVCFEVDPAKATGVPVLGVDPIPGYAPLLDEAGFEVEAYEETPGWETRVYGTFGALVEASDALLAELGDRAAAGALAEAMLTVQLKPYPRRVLIVGRRDG